MSTQCQQYEPELLLNNFKTLLRLCANQVEREKLLHDFIVAYHPDRFEEELQDFYTQIILEATDLYNRAPIVFGPGRPFKKANPKKHSSSSTLPVDFIMRCELYICLNKALIYKNKPHLYREILEQAKKICATFLKNYANSAYIDEVVTINRALKTLKVS